MATDKWGGVIVESPPTVDRWGGELVESGPTGYEEIVADAQRTAMRPGETPEQYIARSELGSEIGRQREESLRYKPSALFTTALRVAPPLGVGIATGGMGLLPALGLTGLAGGAGELAAEIAEGDVSIPRVATSTALTAIPAAPLGRIASPLLRGGIRVAEGAAIGAAAPVLERGLQGELPSGVDVAQGAAFGGLVGLPFGGLEALRRAAPKPPKSVQILTEPTTKPPSIANVATEIGTQTAESPYALQARLNQMTEAQRRPIQQLALEETFSGLPPKSAQESAEVFQQTMMPQIETEGVPAELASIAGARQQASAERAGRALMEVGEAPVIQEPANVQRQTQQDIRREYIKTATEAPEVDYQYIVQDFGPEYPRVVQVDAISGGESLASGTVAEFAGAGAKIPEVPEWVPQGKYTREQIEQFIKEGPSNAIREQEAAGRVLRGETPEPELDVGLQGVVGKDQPEVAAGDLVREGAVPEPRTEVEQLMASTPPFEAPAGRSPEATQQASRMRSTRGAVTPGAAGAIAGAPLGGAAGYALTEQEPGESDEAFAARRLRNAALGAAAGAAGGLSLTQIGARALAPSPRMKAERGSTVAPPEPGKGQGVRRTAEKVIEERTYPEQMREMLAENPDIVYDKFARRELQNRMEGLTEAELITLRASPDLREKLASTAELANRYSVTPGKEKEAADLIAEFSTYMTSPAQLIGMGSMIHTPETYVAAVNKQLEQVNRTLSKPQTEQVRKLAAEVIRTDKAMGEAQMAAKNDFTDANIAKKDAAEKAHAEAAKALDQYIHDAVPEAWDKIISKVIQGNLMSPISLMRNVGGNILWQPIRRTSTAIASLLDSAVVGVSKVAGRPKERVLGGANPLPSGEEMRAAGEGIRTAAKELLTGPGVDSYVKSEVQRGFRPLRALVQAWKGDGLAVRPDGTISLNDRAKKAVEAVFGAAPEAIFRGLNLGDKPFRRAAEVEFLRNEGKARGLKGRELNRFVMFPDKATQRLLETEGRKAIFAQENRWAREIKRAIDTWPEKMFENPDDHPFLVGATKVFLRTQLPFVQFPANYVTTAARYAFPWITAPAALLKAAKGDRRGALNLMAEAMMGSMMYGAAAWLWKNGLISEPVEKDSKARSVQYERMGPQRLNITGLQRALAGGDGTFKRGDTTVDWGPMGIPSAPLYVFTRTASQKRGEEAKLGAPQRGNFAIDALGAFPGMASFAFDQSFLSGTASALNAMQDWEQFGDRWTQNMFRAITSFPIPSTVEAAARANYEYIPELRGDTLGQTLKNIWDYKTFQLPEGDRAILKRDIWGEPIRRTPEGKNPYIHQFLDVTRSETKPPDRMKSALLEIYRETETPDVYPSVPGRNITAQGTTVQLNPKDYELLQALTGSYRRELTERLVLDPRFSSSSLPADAKIMLLQNEYQQAAELARARLMSKPDFFDSYPELLGRTLPADQSRVQSRTPQGRLLRKAQEPR